MSTETPYKTAFDIEKDEFDAFLDGCIARERADKAAGTRPARSAKAKAFPREDSYAVYEDQSVLFRSRSGDDYTLTLDPLATASSCSCPASKPCRHQRIVATAPRPQGHPEARLIGGRVTACGECRGEQHRAAWFVPGGGYLTYSRCACGTRLVY